MLGTLTTNVNILLQLKHHDNDVELVYYKIELLASNVNILSI